MILVVRNPQLKVGLLIRPVFSISLHKKDLALLKNIPAFGGGVVTVELVKNMEKILLSIL